MLRLLLGIAVFLRLHFTLGCRVPRPLGMQDGHIADSQISASSVFNDAHAARQGRLHYTGQGGSIKGAWSAGSNPAASGEWLQVDLGRVMKVSHILTQGRHDSDQWVTEFAVDYSSDGTTFDAYKGPAGDRKIFAGNKDRNTVVTQTLSPVIVARFIRIVCHVHHTHPSLRLEVAGCPVAQDCVDLLHSGVLDDGLYVIHPNSGQALQVFCDMTTNGGGFAVFQRRHANTESFRRRWVDYKSGFGNLSADFWLGNDNLHTLTERSQELLIELGDFKGDTAHASFGLFLVGSEAEKYVMRVGEYTGTAGDSFSAAHDGIFFTTDDRNNDGNANENCAVMFHGGWWFNNCHESNLNGQYVEGGDVQEGRGISWKSWKGADESLQSTTMKLRPLKERDWDYDLDFGSHNTSGTVVLPKVTAFQQFTASWWMRPGTAETWVTVFSLANAASPVTHAAFSFRRSGDYRLILNDDITEFSLPDSPITNGHWHHVCITWTSTNGEWKFYVDGLKREGRSSQAGQEVAGGILAIGQMLAGQGSPGSESSLTGLLSRFNVWDKFMADAAVERIADACSPESGNVVPWPDVYVRISGHVTKRASSLCSFPELHRWNVNGKGQLRDLLSTRDVVVSSGDGREPIPGVLSLQDGESISVPFSKSCITNPSFCEHGLSLSFWLRHKHDTRHILSSDGSPLAGPGLSFHYDGVSASYTVVLSTIAGRVWEVTSLSDTLAESDWFHVTVTWSARTGLRLYRQGAVTAQRLASTQHIMRVYESSLRVGQFRSPRISSNSLVIGRDDADVSDLRLWETALPESRIESLYKGTGVKTEWLLWENDWSKPVQWQLGGSCQGEVESDETCIKASLPSDRDYRHVGCFGVKGSNDPIPLLENLNRSLVVADPFSDWTTSVPGVCAQASRASGFSVFGLRDGGQWCGSSSDADATYDKYGPSVSCGAEGLGGADGMDVYWVTTDSLNIACKRDTKQSSTEHQSALAVDGRHQFASSPELFSSTTAESSPWWGVDLGRSALVDHVVLYFPKDPSQARVWKLEVRIGEIPPDDGIVGPLCGPAVVVLNEWKRHVRCSSVRLGRYVTLRGLTAHDKLLLTEVKVLRAVNHGNPQTVYDKGDDYKMISSGQSIDGVAFIEKHVQFSAFSVCVWMRMAVVKETATILSAALSSHKNGIWLALKERSVFFRLYAHREKYNAQLYEDQWYHLCVTWEQAGGSLAYFLDGALAYNTTMAHAGDLATSIIRIGQRGVNINGNSFEQEVFTGALSHVNMWDYVLEAATVTSMARVMCGSPFIGNVVNWAELRFHFHGDVQIQPLCTNTDEILASRECRSYASLSNADRADSYTGDSVAGCDGDLDPGWFRFTGPAGSRMADECVPEHRCGTHAPGWLHGVHPLPEGGLVTRKVCFSAGGSCCNRSEAVTVRNCGEFYVYHLKQLSNCSSRYCGTDGGGDFTRPGLSLAYAFQDASFPASAGSASRLEGPYVIETHNCLRFSYRMAGPDSGRLGVFMVQDGGSDTPVLLWRLAGYQGNGWKTAQVPVDVKRPYKIFFESVAGSGPRGDIAVDGIAFGVSTGCFVVPSEGRLQIRGVGSSMIGHIYNYQHQLETWIETESEFGGKYWRPCYRALADGWSTRVFFEKCSQKGPSLTLIRKSSYIFGGFTDKDWKMESAPVAIPSNQSFLFSLSAFGQPDSARKFSLLPSQGGAITRAQHKAPLFGGLGAGDLSVELDQAQVTGQLGSAYESPTDPLPFFTDGQTPPTVEDVEVLIIGDTLCDPPCSGPETCDEIIGRCVCDSKEREEEWCRLRQASQQKRDQFCSQILHSARAQCTGRKFARHDHSSLDQHRKWRCYDEVALTADHRRYDTVGASNCLDDYDVELTSLSQDHVAVAFDELLVNAVHYWPLDGREDSKDLKGTTWLDHAQLETAGPGPRGTAVRFRPLAAGPVPLSSKVLVSYMKDITIALWLRYEKDNGPQTFLRADFVQNARFRFFQPTGSADHVALELTGSVGSHVCRRAFQSPSGVWSHYVFSWRSLVLCDVNVLIYLNGQVVVGSTPGPFQPADWVPTPGQVLIGMTASQSSSATFDEIAIWRQQLTQQDVGVLYQFYKGLPNLRVFISMSMPQEDWYDDYENQESERFLTKVGNVTSLVSSLYPEGYVQRIDGFKFRRTSGLTMTFTVSFLKSGYQQVLPLETFLETRTWNSTPFDYNLTANDISTATSLLVTYTNSTVIEVNFSIPAPPPTGLFQFFELVIRPNNSNNNRTDKLPHSTNWHRFDGLHPGTKYVITVTPWYLEGAGKQGAVVATTAEERPGAPPRNFTLTKKTTASLSLRWNPVTREHRSGVIRGYVVEYTSLATTPTGAQTKATFVCAEKLSLDLKGLRVFTRYLVTVGAFTSAGKGPLAAINETTKQLAPDGVPQNISTVTSTPTNIKLSWEPVGSEEAGGRISGYKVIVVDLLRRSNYSLTFNASTFNADLDDCKPYTTYEIRMLAISGTVPGNSSRVIQVVTPEDAPSSSPRNLTILRANPASANLQWLPVDKYHINGKLRYYKLTYFETLRPGATLEVLNVSAANLRTRRALSEGDESVNFELTGLRPYTEYSVRVLAVTVEEGIPTLNKTFQTAEGVPSAPPGNVTAWNTSSSSILVQWQPVPAHHVNGLLRGYHVYYQAPGHVNASFVTVGNKTHSHELKDLGKFVQYAVRVAAVTVADGNASEPVLCMTDQDVPDAPPAAIREPGVTTTSILVRWLPIPRDKRNGPITAYQLELYRDGLLLRTVDIHDALQSSLNISSLDVWTLYGVRMRGCTVKGCGPWSTELRASTDEEAPSRAPTNIRATAISSTSIHVTWGSVLLPALRGVFRGYRVHYQSAAESPHPITTRNVTVETSITAVNLTGLYKFTHYRIYVTAFSTRDGVASDDAFAKTQEDVPSAAPADIYFSSPSSTAIRVRWRPVPASHRNGIIEGYRVKYRAANGVGAFSTRALSLYTEWTMIRGLQKYELYTVQLTALTGKGEGPAHTATFRTAEDVPSESPQSLRAESHVSVTSIPLTWRPIPAPSVHGVLRGYKVRYHAVSIGGIKTRARHVSERWVGAGSPSTVLLNLQSYAVYRIEVVGFTNRGTGPPAVVVAATCRCRKRLTSSWRPFPPYVINPARSSERRGLIAPLLTDMVSVCCGFCRSHGKSFVDYEHDGLNQKSMQKLDSDLKKNLSHRTDFAFPIYGFPGQERYAQRFGYHGIVVSPGIAYIVNTKTEEKMSAKLFQNVIGCWPAIVLSALLTYVAGVLIWLLESRHDTPGFPASFTAGAYEGFYWAFVSMTTVGYGDRAPRSIEGRLMALVIILFGLVLFSLVTANIATSLTSMVARNNYMLYGTKVAAVADTPEYRLGVRRNAILDPGRSYSNLDDVIEALERKDVTGILIDTFAGGSRTELLDKPNLRVYQVLGVSSTYGAVLAGESTKLARCFRAYNLAYAANITRHVERNTQQLRVKSAPLPVKRSTHLFESGSPLFRVVLFICVGLLACFVVAGLLVEWVRRMKNRTRIYNEEPDKMRLQQMRAFVSEWFETFQVLVNNTRTRHLKEQKRLALLKRKLTTAPPVQRAPEKPPSE